MKVRRRVVLTVPAAVAAAVAGTGGAAQAGAAGRARVPGAQVLEYHRARLTVTEHEVRRHDGAVVRDISYQAPGAAAVRAWLVEPERAGRPGGAAGVLALHWFHPGDPTSSRLEFLDEAVALAARGTVSLLPDLTFPWAGDPAGDAGDLTTVATQAIAVRRGLDLLHDHRDVDSRRVAVVGHDYGGMYGLLIAAVDRDRVRTAVAVNVDATFSNWFLQFWLGFEGEAATAYQRLLEPVDPIRYLPYGPRGGFLFQFSVPDFFLPDSTARTLYAAASHPKDQRLYPGAPHKLDDPAARADRAAWLTAKLGLPPG